FRGLPAVDDAPRPFWTGGEHGELRIRRCQACRLWLHPPGPVCPRCLSTDLAPEATSGRAVVHTYTNNHPPRNPGAHPPPGPRRRGGVVHPYPTTPQPWYRGPDPPYVVAIVALPEQEGLRLTTN